MSPWREIGDSGRANISIYICHPWDCGRLIHFPLLGCRKAMPAWMRSATPVTHSILWSTNLNAPSCLSWSKGRMASRRHCSGRHTGQQKGLLMLLPSQRGHSVRRFSISFIILRTKGWFTVASRWSSLSFFLWNCSSHCGRNWDYTSCVISSWICQYVFFSFDCGQESQLDLGCSKHWWVSAYDPKHARNANWIISVRPPHLDPILDGILDKPPRPPSSHGVQAALLLPITRSLPLHTHLRYRSSVQHRWIHHDR